MKFRPAARLMSLLLLYVALGCDRLDLVPVSGVVTVDGKPVEAIDVYFEPVPEARGEGEPGEHPHLGSHGITDADGRYTLTQLDTGKPGATVGIHTVRLADIRAGLPPEEGATFVPSRLGLNEGSELEFEVPPEGTNQAVFNLDSKTRH